MALLRLGIWKRTSTARSVASVEANILAYLDETSKPENSKYPGMTPSKIAGKGSDFLQSGIDYLSKEEKGRLKVFGFLRDDIFEMTGKYAQHLTNNERARAANEAWKLRMKRREDKSHYAIQKVAHKFVLALNPKYCEKLVQLGISTDEVLTNTVRTLMRRYQEKYYPDDRIGYLVGVHHDKQHIHAHLMLYPTTEKGILLRVTDESFARGDKRPFTWLRETALKLLQQHYDKEIASPGRAPVRAPDKKFQTRVLAHIAMKACESIPDETERLLATERERRRMEALPDEELRAVIRAAYLRETKRCAAITNKERLTSLLETVKSSKKEAEETVAAYKERLRQLNAYNKREKDIYENHMKFFTAWKAYRHTRGRMLGGSCSPAGHKIEELKESLIKSKDFKDLVDQHLLSDTVDANEKETLRRLKEQLRPGGMNPVFVDRATASMFREYAKGLKPAIKMLRSSLNRDASDYVMAFVEQMQKDEAKRRARVAEDKLHLSECLMAAKTRVEAIELNYMTARYSLDKRIPNYLSQWEAMGNDIPLSARRVGEDSINGVYKELGMKKEPVRNIGDILKSASVAHSRMRSRLEREELVSDSTTYGMDPEVVSEARISEQLKNEESAIRKFLTHGQAEASDQKSLEERILRR